MGLDLALVRFNGQTAAESAFGAMRERGGDAPWVHEVALVQRHHSGRIVLHGTFAGHYIDVNEDDHLSQPGAAVGALTGALLGIVFLGGPFGLAPGLVLGGLVGAERGKPDELEDEPEALVERLRATVPKGSSAIVLLAEPDHVDAMMALVSERAESTERRSIDGDELRSLIASVAGTPSASAGPTTGGDAAA